QAARCPASVGIVLCSLLARHLRTLGSSALSAARTVASVRTVPLTWSSFVALATRKIGLSLGADVDWPKAYEEIVAKLDLKMRIGGERVTFHVERTTMEPFDLQAPARYDLVIDRLTHWLPFQREW